ncbi:MAG: iron complex outermembrane receptor protein [Flavobacteriales bacterium]
MSALWWLKPYFSLRASHSTGFRAPTPGQVNISNITTLLADGVLVYPGTIAPTTAIAGEYGGEELKPEESKNYTLGAVFYLGDVSLTVDTYQIDMSDRITQSADIALTAQQAQDLEEAGFAGASSLRSFRFHINDFKSSTRGLDVVASFPKELLGGRSTFNLTYNYNTTKVTHFNPMTLDLLRIRQIEDSLPQHRGNISWSHRSGAWRSLLRANYYDTYWMAHVGSIDLAFEPSAEITLDAEVAFSFRNSIGLSDSDKRSARGGQLTLALGVKNLFNNFPDKNPYSAVTGSKYPEHAPMGIAGGVYYMRLTSEF